jgi:Flp pilus assembly pilin Flp
LWSEESGQDTVEYTLLLAFVCFASAALFIGGGGTINAIWITAQGLLSNASTAAS